MIATQKIRWTGDEDHYFGSFLYAPDKFRNLAVVLGSGDDEDYPGCRLRIQAFGHTLILVLPPIVKPYKIKVEVPGWRTDGTAERLGRDWYFDSHEREYGFSYDNNAGGVGGGGFLRIFLGPQTMAGSTTKGWSCFIPWNNWTHVRHSYYGLTGEHVWTEPEVQWKLLGPDQNMEKHREVWAMRETIPTRTFRFADFDGEVIDCKTRIEEREWRLGTGWFKWLSRFKKPIIHRSLDLDFSKETGRRKGSWKGGTTGHSISMLPGELHESAFKRYCEGNDDRAGKKRDMVFIGEV